MVASHPAFQPRGPRETMWHDPSVVGIPDSVRTTLRYRMTTTATTTTGALYSQQFRGNSVYDPDYTGAGSQPTYFDQLANMYNSFVVLSSRIKIEALNAAAAPVLVGVYPAYNTALGSTSLDCAAMRYAVSKSCYGSGNGLKVVLQQSQSTAQQFGIPEDAVVNDDLYSSVVSTNPAAAQTWYWTVFAQDETGSATLNVSLLISIDYDVKFFDPAVANLSATRRAGASGASAAAAASPTLPSSSLGGCPVRACMLCAHAGEFTPK